MLVPWERQKLQELLSELNTARERLLAFLEIIEEEWLEEYTNRPTEIDDYFEVPNAFRRLDTLMQWIGSINENGIYLEELEGYE
jgi:hypothetical protein